MDHQNDNDYEIDLLRLLKALWKNAWAVILALVLAFSYTKFLITPLYQATALMYVNNSDISLGSTKVSISASDLSAAQSLVDTYVVIMNSRSTLNDVIAESGVSYTYEELTGMISASAVNSTEIFQIVVTDADPVEAELLANTIANILPNKIASIVDGCSARVVDYAVVPTKVSSPSVAKNTALGGVAAAVLCCAIIVALELLNDTIREEDDILQVSELPILAAIPELKSSKNSGGYYGGYGAAATKDAQSGRGQ
jgi:capsular polysaccharide biosynthesis protein